MHCIPFMIDLEHGTYAVAYVVFKGVIKKLKYNYLCITDGGHRMFFRTAADAKMAADENWWKYMGKI